MVMSARKNVKVLQSNDNGDYIDIAGYLVTFTDEDDLDLHGERFSKDTDFWFDKGHDISGHPIYMDHGFDDHLKFMPIGFIESAETDEHGVWIKGKLYERQHYIDLLRNLRNKGKTSANDVQISKASADLVDSLKSLLASGSVYFSSGALPSSVKREGSTITSWVIGEASLTVKPAEPDGTDVSMSKSMNRFLNGVSLKNTDPIGDGYHEEDQTSTLDENPIVLTKELEMSPEQVLEMLKTYLAALIKEMASQLGLSESETPSEEEVVSELAIPEEELPTKEEEEMSEEELEEAVKSLMPYVGKAFNRARSAKVAKRVVGNASQFTKSTSYSSGKAPSLKKSPEGERSRIEVSSRFSDWTVDDFSFMYAMQHTTKGAYGALDRLANNSAVAQEFIEKASKSHQKGEYRLPADAVKSINSMKANEVMQTTLSGYGDEWVPTLWNDSVWDKPRTDVVATNVFKMIDMPSNPFKYPVESGDPTVYYVPETANQAQLSLDSTTTPFPLSRIGTSDVTFTAKKLATSVPLSLELEEDALAFTIPHLRQQAQTALLHALDSVVFNGDTATTGNVNSDGETITATNRQYQALNGLIKQALVTASGNSLDASGSAPTLTHIRALRAKLAPAIGVRASNLALIMDVQSYLKLLNEGAVLTEDKYGRDATVITGQLGTIDGIPVFSTEDMALADTDGKITQTSNVADRGRILLVHRPSWLVGYKRRPTQTMTLIPYFDMYQLVVSVRFDFAGRTAGANDDSVAILYNVGV